MPERLCSAASEREIGAVMKAVVVQVALIGMLAVCATSLRKQLDATRSGIAIERSRAGITERVRLTSIAGVDIHGDVRETGPEGAKRIVVTGFRAATVDRDISFWTAVAALLADEPDIHIVAYCEDARCANAAREMRPSWRFTVMRYGEASNTQALLYVDGRGDGFVLGPEMKTIRRIAWRTPGTLAEDIAWEVRQ
jgi:hypothetical protein